MKSNLGLLASTNNSTHAFLWQVKVSVKCGVITDSACSKHICNDKLKFEYF